MTKNEIEQILSLANGGDVRKAVEADLLESYGSLAGMEAMIGGVVYEVEQWRDSDDETRAGIEAYKAAKTPAKGKASNASAKAANGKGKGKGKGKAKGK